MINNRPITTDSVRIYVPRCVRPYALRNYSFGLNNDVYEYRFTTLFIYTYAPNGRRDFADSIVSRPETSAVEMCAGRFGNYSYTRTLRTSRPTAFGVRINYHYVEKREKNK